ncbi:MAG: hypothetical protein FJ387_07015 [Verrucomicrobia bacterium]|nr:hypothetical protein [Verrucomicrobiota bacterium]
MDSTRYRIEKTILEQNFSRRSAFVDRYNPETFSLRVGLKCSSGQAYQLRIRIPPDYPNSIPRAYVMTPADLRDRAGQSLAQRSPSHDMHLLSPDGNQIQLCHYKPANWHPNVTLYKVALKCLVWLEAYENHMLTGKPIDHFLHS